MGGFLVGVVDGDPVQRVDGQFGLRWHQPGGGAQQRGIERAPAEAAGDADDFWSS